MSASLRREKGRLLSWGLADQAASSGCSFALGLAVARSVTLSTFGAFSLSLAVYYLTISLSRAVSSDPFMVRFSAVPLPTWGHSPSRALGGATAVGIAFGSLLAVSGLLVDSPLKGPFIAMGLSLPVLTLQDAYRFVFFAAGRPSSAFAVDATWLALTLLGIVGLLTLSSERASAVTLTAVWALAGGGSLCVSWVRSRVIPSLKSTKSWITEHRDLTGRYILEAILNTGGYQVAIVGIGAAAGLARMGSIRSTILLFGPLNILFQGLRGVLIPEGVKQFERNPDEMRRQLNVLLVLLVGSTFLLTGALAAMPPKVGGLLLGNNWNSAQRNVGPIGASFMCIAATISYSVGLRALAAARASLRAQAASALAIVVSPVAAVLIFGGESASYGYAAGAIIGTTFWHRAYSLASREHGRSLSGNSQ